VGSSASSTNVTTDVSTEPSILQIRGNGNGPEEEGGDDVVDIDYMLLDELEVYRQQFRWYAAPNSTASDGCYDILCYGYDSYCDGCYVQPLRREEVAEDFWWW
jgi:hypothetical protein